MKAPFSFIPSPEALVVLLLLARSVVLHGGDPHRRELEAGYYDDRTHRKVRHLQQQQQRSLPPIEPHQDAIPTSYSCGMEATHEEKAEMNRVFHSWRRKHGRRNLQTESYDIPIQLTVFQPTTTEGRVDNATQNAMIETLNYGFRDTPFSFYLLQPALHVVDRRYAECRRETEFRTLYRNPSVDTLSVFLCNTYSVGVAGFTFPPVVTENKSVFDGVVLMNPAMTSNVANDDLSFVSQVFIHEVGHVRKFFLTDFVFGLVIDSKAIFSRN